MYNIYISTSVFPMQETSARNLVSDTQRTKCMISYKVYRLCQDWC